MNKNKFLSSVTVIDTETTNLYAEKAEIVEVAGAKYKNNNWETTSMLLGAVSGIPPEASAKNNISQRMIDGLPVFNDKVNEVKNILGWDNSSYYVAHNTKYDQAVLAQAYTNAGLTEDVLKAQDKKNWICTFRLAKQLIDFDFKDMQYNLSYLRYRLDLPVDDSLGVHRAEADTVVCATLFEFLVDYAYSKDLIDDNGDIGQQLHALCWKPAVLKTWPYGKHRGVDLSEVPTDYYIWALSNMDKLKENSPDYDPDLAENVRIELEKRLTA